MALQQSSDKILRRDIQDVRKTLVGIEHGAIGIQRSGPFIDAFDEYPVRMFRALQNYNLLALLAIHHQSINSSIADGVDNFMGFDEAVLQALHGIKLLLKRTFRLG